MSDWKMLRSDEFTRSRNEWFARFSAEARSVLEAHEPRKARAFLPVQKDLFGFLQLLDDLHHGAVRPEDHLSFVSDDDDGKELYSAISKNWRCLFLIDRADNLEKPCGSCTAGRVHPISGTVKLSETVRHHDGSPLECRLAVI